jgi:hypothetical protein
MEDEAATGLDWTAVVDGAVGRLARIEVELLQERAKLQARPFVADPDSHRSIFVMNAHGDHRPLEPGVRHSGHGEEKLSGKEGGALHTGMMGRRTLSGKAE